MSRFVRWCSTLLAASGCWSSPASAPIHTPGSPTAIPSLSVAPIRRLEHEYIPIVMIDASDDARVGQLLSDRGIEWTSTCIHTCTLHVIDTDAERARALLRGEPDLRVIEQSEYEAMIAPPEPMSPLVEISRSDLEQQLRTPMDLQVQWNHPGGILVRHVAPASVFERVGLRDGDVIARFDGSDVHGADDAMRADQLVRIKDRFTLEVERKGQRMKTEVFVR